MGTGKQQSFFKNNWKHRFSHGGLLRNTRLGRGQRPLSCKEPLHVVFKIERSRLRHHGLRSSQGLSLLTKIIKKYTEHFAVKIEQLSVQGDHIHILIRASRRSKFHDFFRVVAGQIAQRFEKEGLLKVTHTPHGSAKGGTSLWKYRPFSRVVRGWKAFKIVCDYILLNEQEILGKIRYHKNRLRGLSNSDWKILKS